MNGKFHLGDQINQLHWLLLLLHRSIKSQPDASYRMDKDDGYNSMASSLVNLSRLMEQEQTRYELFS